MRLQLRIIASETGVSQMNISEHLQTAPTYTLYMYVIKWIQCVLSIVILTMIKYIYFTINIYNLFVTEKFGNYICNVVKVKVVDSIGILINSVVMTAANQLQSLHHKFTALLYERLQNLLDICCYVKQLCCMFEWLR